MGTGGGGGSDSSSYGENFAKSTGSNWNSNAADTRNINASQARTNQDVWAPQANMLGKVYDEAETQYGQAKAGINAYNPQAKQELGWIKDQTAPAYENQSKGGVMGNRGIEDYYINSMQNSIEGPSMAQQAYGESAPQLNQMYRRQANDARNDMMNSMDSRAAASGMSGGSRHGTALARGNQDINSNLQNQMALASDRDVDRRLGVAGQADQALLNRQGMMQGEVAGMNAAQQGALGQAQNMGNVVMQGYDPMMMGMKNLGMGAQIIGGPTTLSQSATDSLGISGSQSRGSGGGQNQSDAYSWNSSDSATNPNYNFSLPTVSAPKNKG